MNPSRNSQSFGSNETATMPRKEVSKLQQAEAAVAINFTALFFERSLPFMINRARLVVSSFL